MGTNTDKLTRKRDNVPRATRRTLAYHPEESTGNPLHLVLQQPGRGPAAKLVLHGYSSPHRRHHHFQ